MNHGTVPNVHKEFEPATTNPFEFDVKIQSRNFTDHKSPPWESIIRIFRASLVFPVLVAIYGHARGRESEAATRALDDLEMLLKDPERQTALVLVAGSVDKRSRMYRLLLKHATLVECGVLVDQADAERWVRNRIAASRAEIEPAAAHRLLDRGVVAIELVADGGPDEIGAIGIESLRHQEVDLPQIDIAQVDGDLLAVARLRSKLLNVIGHLRHP